MTSNFSLATALCLSEEDTIALISGRSIAALSRMFINSGQNFAICSTGDSPKVEAWAELISNRMYTDSDQAEALSWNTIWSREYLYERIQDRKRIFLNILKVHHLEKGLTIDGNISGDKVGGFIKLPQSLMCSSSNPILKNATFLNRKERLEKLTPPEHPELEELQGTIAHYAKDHPEAQGFSDGLQEFLGWTEPKSAIINFPDWISEITTSGNSSDGYLFEKLVRQSFVQLGFTNNRNDIKASMDPDATGGAGGIDLYCENPFAIVGECKASKNEGVSNSVSAQLIHLGTTNLNDKSEFDSAIKIIFTSGKLTNHTEKATIKHEMNIMRPETLQRLVELKVAHPGSIDLLELKPCLEAAPFGTDSDKKVNEFIDRIYQRLNIRSHLIQAVRALQDGGEKNINSTTIKVQFNAIRRTENWV